MGNRKIFYQWVDKTKSVNAATTQQPKSLFQENFVV